MSYPFEIFISWQDSTRAAQQPNISVQADSPRGEKHILFILIASEFDCCENQLRKELQFKKQISSRARLLINKIGQGGGQVLLLLYHLYFNAL